MTTLTAASHCALPNGSSCSLHVPPRAGGTGGGSGGVAVNGWRSGRGGVGGVGGGRSSSPDDDSAVLVDHRADCDDDSDTRTALLSVRSALQ